MNIGHALDSIREERKISKNELSRQTGLSVTGLNNIFKNRKSPTIDTFLTICEALKVTPSSVFDANAIWIDNDVLFLLKNANEQAKKTAIYALEIGQSEQSSEKCILLNGITQNDQHITIPVVGRAAAGVPIEMLREYDESIDIAGPVKQGDFAVIAVGDSMTGDDIHDGDRVVIRKQDVVEDGELALVAVDGGSTIKRVHFNGKTIHLIPSNSAYKPQIYDFMHDVRILGKVIQVIKSTKI